MAGVEGITGGGMIPSASIERGTVSRAIEIPNPQPATVQFMKQLRSRSLVLKTVSANDKEIEDISSRITSRWVAVGILSIFGVGLLAIPFMIANHISLGKERAVLKRENEELRPMLSTSLEVNKKSISDDIRDIKTKLTGQKSIIEEQLRTKKESREWQIYNWIEENKGKTFSSEGRAVGRDEISFDQEARDCCKTQDIHESGISGFKIIDLDEDEFTAKQYSVDNTVKNYSVENAKKKDREIDDLMRDQSKLELELQRFQLLENTLTESFLVDISPNGK